MIARLGLVTAEELFSRHAALAGWLKLQNLNTTRMFLACPHDQCWR
jgi:hypothetical protein